MSRRDDLYVELGQITVTFFDYSKFRLDMTEFRNSFLSEKSEPKIRSQVKFVALISNFRQTSHIPITDHQSHYFCTKNRFRRYLRKFIRTLLTCKSFLYL